MTQLLDDMMNKRRRRTGNTGTFLKYDLFVANACRLFLKITMLSDILNEEGTAIQEWVFTGTQQLDTTI